ncbi:hypothetical protein FHX37_2709 [Haloactinospora alba]|uniref:VanZ like protein n=1 Tax=Haloactinospora alba TaxID=405555 RepID=A0A543NLM2_9ACTN|nr:hypothetical protein [Haloactinospora alba]TQN32731.1 hypothetical protein FHX37_2709 [Haloactinospora alba]
MEGIFTGTPGSAALAPSAFALAALVALAVFGANHRRRFGRFNGWPGQVTMAVLATAVGVGAYALWPLPHPAGVVCPAPGDIRQPAPLATVSPLSWEAAAHAGLAAGALLPVGLLARYRYRRGIPAALAAGGTLALLVELVQASAVAGTYPCPYRVAALDDVVLGALGAFAGWFAGAALDRVLPRAWPSAVPDIMPPGLSRRVLGHVLDVGVWWYGAAVLAATAATVGALPSVGTDVVGTAALVALALALGIVTPLVRRDRCPPGRAASRLALSRKGPPEPASRPRTLLRSGLLYVPLGTLFLLDLGWWAPAVAAVHGAPILFRRDQAGLADLIAGTRVVTRMTLCGGLPRDLVRAPAGSAVTARTTE